MYTLVYTLSVHLYTVYLYCDNFRKRFNFFISDNCEIWLREGSNCSYMRTWKHFNFCFMDILVIYGIIKTVDIFFQNSVEMLITYRFEFMQISIFKVFITLTASQGFGRVRGDKLWSCHVKCKFNFAMCLKRYKYIFNSIYIFHRGMQMLIWVEDLIQIAVQQTLQKPWV